MTANISMPHDLYLYYVEKAKREGRTFNMTITRMLEVCQASLDAEKKQKEARKTADKEEVTPK